MMRRYDMPGGVWHPLYKSMLEDGHLLIAGTTGSGKSVVLNGLLYTAMHEYSPDDATFIVIDPKRVELFPYSALPHTWIYAEEAEQINAALSAAIHEMDRRYIEMQRNWRKTYNGPTVFCIIDELADILSGDRISKEIEKNLTALMRKGRAAKVFIIAATQDPSRRTIKAFLQQNFTGRIALRCLNAIESRQILGTPGAEALPRYGSMLYRNAEGTRRINGIPLVEDADIFKRINFWRYSKAIYA